MIVLSVTFVDFSYYFARVTNGNHIGWNVFSDYAASANYRVFTYGNARQHDRVCAKPYVVTDTYRNIELRGFEPEFWADGMCACRDGYVRCSHHVITDEHVGVVNKREVTFTYKWLPK